MADQVLFSGSAHLYLDGQGALYPFRWFDEREVIYFIGSPGSKYRIIDSRQEVNKMAISAINSGGENWSPEKFCTPSYVEVKKDGEGLSILLKVCHHELTNLPILWMGTFEGDELPANPVLWLQYTDIEKGRAAFIGIVDPTLSAVYEEHFVSVQN